MELEVEGITKPAEAPVQHRSGLPPWASAILFIVILATLSLMAIFSMEAWMGWLYTAITVYGSCYFSLIGESKTAWANYVLSTVVGMTYFLLIGNPSQFTLIAFFCAMNAWAIIRLYCKDRGIDLVLGSRKHVPSSTQEVGRGAKIAEIILYVVILMLSIAISETLYFGWLYTCITIFGSFYITTRGESTIAWENYVLSAIVGMFYFVILANASQFSLSLFFCIMNSCAIARLQCKKRGMTLLEALHRGIRHG